MAFKLTDALLSDLSFQLNLVNLVNDHNIKAAIDYDSNTSYIVVLIN